MIQYHRLMTTRRARNLLIASIVIIAAGVGVLLAVHSAHPPGTPSAPHRFPMADGGAGPSHALESPGGERHSFPLARETDVMVLLCFLDTQAEAGDRERNDSRAQLPVLKSMDHQYRSRGLRSVVVHRSSSADAGSPTPDSLINFKADWNLGDIQVLPDADGALAEKYQIRESPTTILLNPDGQTIQRWNGFVRPGEIGLFFRGSLK